jgi:hypothetical protein
MYSIQLYKFENLKKYNKPMYEIYLIKEMFLNISEKTDSVYLNTINAANRIREVRSTLYIFFQHFANSL